ncbi:hypothetical protein [Streptomyces sp. NRRL S-118]|nr:hypothetical protein [Streptomyces sp. NRRL S-118]
MRMETGDVTLEVRDSGTGGEAVLLVHGFPDTHALRAPRWRR